MLRLWGDWLHVLSLYPGSDYAPSDGATGCIFCHSTQGEYAPSVGRLAACFTSSLPANVCIAHIM